MGKEINSTIDGKKMISLLEQGSLTLKGVWGGGKKTNPRNKVALFHCYYILNNLKFKSEQKVLKEGKNLAAIATIYTQSPYNYMKQL